VLVAWSPDAIASGVASQNRAAGSRRNDEQGHCQGIEDRSQDRFALAHAIRRATFGGHRKRLAATRTPATSPRANRTRDYCENHRELPANATHWSTRTLAKALGTSPTMVQRVWKANGLQPHRTKTFKLSNDPHFAEKLLDVVGLYLNPPAHALVLCADEKTSIQALDRTQRGLPINPGRCGTMTADYKRNGTTTLFAAIEMAEGKLIGTCMTKHRHQEWIKFLRQIDSETPADLDLHLIVDNYATHKHPKVKSWLKRHSRFHMHFIPTSSSWLNLIERWFREITTKRLRRGTFRNVAQLIEAIVSFIKEHNSNPRSFTWTAKADEILAKIERARKVLHKTPTA